MNKLDPDQLQFVEIIAKLMNEHELFQEEYTEEDFERVVTWTPIILYISPYMDIIHWNKFDIRAFIPHIVIIVVFSIIYLTIKRIFKKKIKHS